MTEIRKNCLDQWNAKMLQGAHYSKHDFPIFNGTTIIPKRLISYAEAKTIYNKEIKYNPNFYYDAFVHTYIDDQHFDGKENSIWLNPKQYLVIVKHFAGVIAPDFSTNIDFPEPIKSFNIYRSRALGYFTSTNNIQTIHNARWGYADSWEYCFDGIPKGSMVCIGTVASGLKKKCNRHLFEAGFLKLLDTIKPTTILVYGSSNYKCFNYARSIGIQIITYESSTNVAHRRAKES